LTGPPTRVRSVRPATLDDAPIWIQYALEPLAFELESRDADLIRPDGRDEWFRSIVDDAAMAAALTFVRESVAALAGGAAIDRRRYGNLVDGAAVLRPIDA
jgi:hypothetical protein